MPKHVKTRARRALGAVLCCLLLALAGAMAARGTLFARREAPPPGVRAAKRTLVTVWMAGDTLGAAAWARRAAGAYAKENPGVSVWVRTASQADLDALEDTGEGAPDVFLFSLGTRIAPEWLRPLELNAPVDGKKRDAGSWAGALLAVPVCLTGYALAARAEAPAPTRAPVSLLGVSPPPAATPAPLRTLAPEEWPGEITAEEGFGAVALSLLSTGARPRLVGAGQALPALEAGQTEAVMLSARQLEACRAGMTVLAAAPATDLALFAAAARAGGAHAEGFVQSLLGEDAQRALAREGLLAARENVYLYAGDRPAQALCERALARGELPNAFTWPERRAETLSAAQALCMAGVSAGALVFE